MESSTATRPGDPIAIIGSGCRFPGKASSPSKLWELLSRPEDLLTEIPSSRFNPQGFYNPDGEYHGHSNVLHSYVLAEDIRAFDADFFNVSVAEATAIDPQQRLLMETVYEALEDGGQSMNKLRGSDTAVYVGLMCEEYSGMQMKDVNSLPTVSGSLNLFRICHILFLARQPDQALHLPVCYISSNQTVIPIQKQCPPPLTSSKSFLRLKQNPFN
jgi:hybrid polyketide synthase/nonribosomal peptide synthetase ACE1